MENIEESDDFEPDRVETLSEWRLVNSAPPLKEEDFQHRLQISAQKANQAFDQFIACFRKPREGVAPESENSPLHARES